MYITLNIVNYSLNDNSITMLSNMISNNETPQTPRSIKREDCQEHMPVVDGIKLCSVILLRGSSR